MSEALELNHLGSLDRAKDAALRAEAQVPAYRRHLHDSGGSVAGAWTEIPLMDKGGYLLRHSFADLLADNFTDTFTIFSSSGSSGRPFYWPQLKGGNKEMVAGLKRLLEQVYQVEHRRTLAIVGLALGSWIGGDHFSWVLKSLAAEVPYPFAVFSPGSRHDEIINMIEAAEKYVDQMIVFVCPSAVGHLRLRAKQAGRSLPMDKLRFIVIGEPFPEVMRSELQEAGKIPAHEPVMLSIFGSADTGVLGVESPASALIRRWCGESSELREQLGFDAVVPHLFHVVDPAVLLETVDGQLCVTKWQGIPLIRYNLHDAARLLRWQEIVCKVRSTAPAEFLMLLDLAQSLPDIMAITGRADSCLLLCGTNLTESMLDAALRAPELTQWLTGNYRAKVILEEGRQRLEIRLECRQDVPVDAATTEAIYPILTQTLGRAQPEFMDDWTNIYQQWDSDPKLRILALSLVKWPGLADSGTIKQRGIVK